MPATYNIDPTQAASGSRYQYGKDLPALSVGDQILYRCGYYHDGTGAGSFANGDITANNVTVANYGSGSKPFLDARCWEPANTTAGWAQVRDTTINGVPVRVWRKTMVPGASAALSRLWTGAYKIGDGLEIGSRVTGLSRGRMPMRDPTKPTQTTPRTPYDIIKQWTVASNETDAVDALVAAYTAQGRIWCSLEPSGDRVLYMLVPSQGASDYPPAWYGGLAYLQIANASTTIGAGSPRGIRYKNASGGLVDSVIASGGLAAIDSDAPTTANVTSWTVRNCEARLWRLRGILADSSPATSASPYGQSNLLIEDNIVDAEPTADEQDPLTDSGYFHDAESIELASYHAAAPFSNVTVQRNVVNGLQHNGINIVGAGSADGVGVMQGVTCRFNKITAEDWMTDTRGMAIQGTSGGQNYVYGNEIINACVKSEFSGDVKVTGNFWLGVRRSVSQSSNQCAVRLGPVNAESPVTLGLEFAYNTILGCESMLAHFVATGIDIVTGAINYHHNLGQMIGDAESIAYKVTNAGGFSVQTGGITIQDNHVERATEPTIGWRVTGTGTQDTGDTVTGGPNPTSAAIVYGGNTWGTKLRPIPAAVYPPQGRGNLW